MARLVPSLVFLCLRSRLTQILSHSLTLTLCPAHALPRPDLAGHALDVKMLRQLRPGHAQSWRSPSAAAEGQPVQQVCQQTDQLTHPRLPERTTELFQ